MEPHGHNYIARYPKPGGGYRYLYPGDERGKFLHDAHERLKRQHEQGNAPLGTSAKEMQQAIAERRKHVEEHLDNEHEKNKKAFQLFHDILHKKKDADFSSVTKEEWERAHRHTFSHEPTWEGPVSAFKKQYIKKSMDAIDRLEELSKGQARGGAYYRRVPTGNPKRPYDYYYTKEAYERAHGSGAHVNGGEAKEDRKKAAYQKYLDKVRQKEKAFDYIHHATVDDLSADWQKGGLPNDSERSAVEGVYSRWKASGKVYPLGPDLAKKQIFHGMRLHRQKADSTIKKSEVAMDAIDQLAPLSKGGPYIGPKGGKWADPQHTIPWKEETPTAEKKGPQTEREYEDEILRMIRRNQETRIGVKPVMRNLHDGGVGVIDLGQSEPKPGGYDWETRDKRIATGSTWKEVYDQLSGKAVPEKPKPQNETHLFTQSHAAQLRTGDIVGKGQHNEMRIESVSPTMITTTYTHGGYIGMRGPKKRSQFKWNGKGFHRRGEYLHADGPHRIRKSEVAMDAIDQLEKAARKKTPHPVSEAQRRWAFAAEARGELPKGKAREWSRRVKGKNLPEAKMVDAIEMLGKRTPGIRRALRALAEAKNANTQRVAQGKAPIIEGEKVSLETFSRRTGAPGSKKEAKERLAAKMVGDAIDLIGKFADLMNKEGQSKDQKADKKNDKPPFGKKPNGNDGKPQPGDKREYKTKIENPEKPGEFTFELLSEDERPEDARFVVSDETPEGAHWEMPHHSEHYEHFKQWKAARKQGLQGTDIPEELVHGAMKHAQKHHFDAGPHKAAYDDYLAHQNSNGAPKPPPSHHTMNGNGNGNGNNGSHPAMRSKDENGKGQPPMKSGQQPPQKPEKKPQMMGKMVIPADEMQDTKTYGVSRSGTERPAVGSNTRTMEDNYQEIFGYMKEYTEMKSMDAIDQLEVLSKAGPYIGPKGGQWADPKHTIPWKGEKQFGPATKQKLAQAQKWVEKSPLSLDSKKLERDLRLLRNNPPRVRTVWSTPHLKRHVIEVWSTVTGKYIPEGERKEESDAHKELKGWIEDHKEKIQRFRDAIGESERAEAEKKRKPDPYPGKTFHEALMASGKTKKSEGSEPMYQQEGDTYKLSKGIYSYDDRDGKAKDLPDAYLFEYLAGFVKEAITSYDCRNRLKALTAGEDIYTRAAQEAMQMLVRQMPQDKNLMRATKKYKVTQQTLADIIKQRNFIATPSDSKPSGRDYNDPASSYFSTDWDSMTSMGVTGDASPTGEVMLASEQNPWAQGAPGVKLASEPDARPAVPMPGNPFGDVGVLHKSKVRQLYPDQSVRANVNASCIIHGSRDLTKDQNFQNPHGACTCKR